MTQPETQSYFICTEPENHDAMASLLGALGMEYKTYSRMTGFFRIECTPEAAQGLREKHDLKVANANATVKMVV